MSSGSRRIVTADESDAAITVAEFNALAATELPFIRYMDLEFITLERNSVLVSAHCDENTLRPGGTIAGPVMMGLADVAFYALVLANVGMVALAVTTSLNINFLRKPGPGNLLCRARLLKLGKRLAVCDASLFSEGEDEDQPAAHVTGTYSIPPR